MWIHYVIRVFFFTQQKTWKILHQDNKRYDEFWEGVVCMLMTYCPAPGVLFVDVGLVVKELWYDLDPTLSAGIHQWRHVISEENNKEYEYWSFKENKFFTTTFDKHTPIYRFCASNWNKVIHISFFYTMYIYIYIRFRGTCQTKIKLRDLLVIWIVEWLNLYSQLCIFK